MHDSPWLWISASASIPRVSSVRSTEGLGRFGGVVWSSSVVGGGNAIPALFPIGKPPILDFVFQHPGGTVSAGLDPYGASILCRL